MGPQHPSTHGVLRLVLELEGETVTDCRPVIGYLHTGIEKNIEFRTWTQGVTFLTRADYLAPLFNEAAYCLAVETAARRAKFPSGRSSIRVMLMEINRVASHWVWLATGGLEIGALTAMTNGFRARERCLDVLELITGLRMNHAFIRPGGVAQDLPDGTGAKVRDWLGRDAARSWSASRNCCAGQPIWVNAARGRRLTRCRGLPRARRHRPAVARCRSALGSAQDDPYLGLRGRSTSTCRPTTAAIAGRGSWCACAEMHESLKIVEQVLGSIGTRTDHDRRPQDRLAGKAARSARTAWATRWSTCKDHGPVRWRR
mgnify:CR=1 FL=1